MRTKMIAAAIAVVVMLLGFVACDSRNDEPYEEIPAANMADDANMRKTVIYLADDYGYIVPVMKQIQWVEGIGASAVSQLIENPDADSQMAYMGLNPILAEGSELSLSIKEGVATIALSEGAISAYNPVDELGKVAAVVNTLTEFVTIDSVIIKQAGCDGKLPCGTDISQPFEPFDLNVTTTLSQADMDNASKLLLYFENEAGTAIVPVTKYVGGKADAFAAMSELVKGPGQGGLRSLFPGGTALLGVSVDDEGVAAINFSKEFSAISDTPQKEKALLRCIILTLMQFDNVDEVQVLVEGKEYASTSQATMAFPAFVNTIE